MRADSSVVSGQYRYPGTQTALCTLAALLRVSGARLARWRFWFSPYHLLSRANRRHRRPDRQLLLHLGAWCSVVLKVLPSPITMGGRRGAGVFRACAEVGRCGLGPSGMSSRPRWVSVAGVGCHHGSICAANAIGVGAAGACVGGGPRARRLLAASDFATTLMRGCIDDRRTGRGGFVAFPSVSGWSTVCRLSRAGWASEDCGWTARLLFVLRATGNARGWGAFSGAAGPICCRVFRVGGR